VTVYVPGIDEKDPKKIILSIQQLAAGRSNGVGSVTLTISVATTTVTDMNCAVGSTVLFTPTTANAATEIGNGTMYLSAVANGSFTVTHANSATTGRTFKYAIVG
jgi:hypothetical protein